MQSSSRKRTLRSYSSPRRTTRSSAKRPKISVTSSSRSVTSSSSRSVSPAAKSTSFVLPVSTTSMKMGSERISLIERLLLERPWKPANGCISSNGSFLNDIVVQGRIGTPSVNGEVKKVCFPGSCDPVTGECTCDEVSTTLVLKQIPMTKGQHRFDPNQDDIFQGFWRAFSGVREVISMELCTYLVLHGGCPNLPLIIDYFFCDACSFSNDILLSHLSQKNMIQVVKHGESVQGTMPCVLILAEYANKGDLNAYLQKNIAHLTHFDDIVRNAIFQVMMGIHALQLNFNLVHGDLHTGNILVFTVPPGGYWEYIFDDTPYYCPNLGYQFVIWDFGASSIYAEGIFNRATDPLFFLKTMLGNSIAAASPILRSQISKMINTVEMQEDTVAIAQMFGPGGVDPYIKPPPGPLLGEYNMDNRMPLPAKMENFLKRGMGRGKRISLTSS